jgi:hypothetical protein
VPYRGNHLDPTEVGISADGGALLHGAGGRARRGGRVDGRVSGASLIWRTKPRSAGPAVRAGA